MRRIQQKLIQYSRTPKPLFFPVWGAACPTFDWPTILVAYSEIRRIARHGNPFDVTKTVTMLESGGFTVSGGAPSQEYCVSMQSQIDPDIAFLLDSPLKIKLAGITGRTNTFRTQQYYESTSMEHRMRVIRSNLENAKIAMRLKEKLGLDMQYMAIIHGYDFKSTMYVTEEMYSLGFDIFGVGTASFVTKSKDHNQEQQVYYMIRDIIGKEAWLHALGQSNIPYLTKIRSVIDSFDSATAIVSANKAVLFTEEGKRHNIGMRNKVNTGMQRIGRLSELQHNPDYEKLISRNNRLFKVTDEQMPDLVSDTNRNTDLKETNFRNMVKYLSKEFWHIPYPEGYNN